MRQLHSSSRSQVQHVNLSIMAKAAKAAVATEAAGEQAESTRAYEKTSSEGISANWMES